MPMQIVSEGVQRDATPEEEAEILAARVAMEPGRIEALQSEVRREREARLAAGFDYDFGDARGVHRIGTTRSDLAGWDEVTKYADALRAANDTVTEIAIATDTGSTTVTAHEWNAIQLAAAAFRQPIWAASFAVEAAVRAGTITSAEGVASAPQWPEV